MSAIKNEDEKRKARTFPKHALKGALRVAEAIRNKNAGKPFKNVFLAQALDMSPTSTNFRDITSSAFKYGLTIGTWNAEAIGLTPLGKALTRPLSPEEEVKNLQESVMKIPLFKTIYEYYKDSKFPINDAYFKNVLEREFSVSPEYINECIDILLENGKCASILTETKSGLFVVFSETPLQQAVEPTPDQSNQGLQEKPAVPEIIPPPTASTKLVNNQIFIIHGKNTAPVEDLKSILTEFKVPFKIAVEEPNIGRPISKKVSELMHSCTSAIVILTADEEYTDSQGNKICRPSDNAIYELGAASVLYGDSIVILKEEGVKLESDFSDLGHITFKKDELIAKSMQVIKELIGFGLLKFTTA